MIDRNRKCPSDTSFACSTCYLLRAKNMQIWKSALCDVTKSTGASRQWHHSPFQTADHHLNTEKVQQSIRFFYARGYTTVSTVCPAYFNDSYRFRHLESLRKEKKKKKDSRCQVELLDPVWKTFTTMTHR